MRPPANMILSLVYKSDAPWNESFWKSPAFDKLLIEARKTLDTTKRKELYCEMQRMISQDAGTIIPSFTNHLDACSEKLQGFTVHPMRPYEGSLYEQAWLET